MFRRKRRKESTYLLKVKKGATTGEKHLSDGQKKELLTKGKANTKNERGAVVPRAIFQKTEEKETEKRKLRGEKRRLISDTGRDPDLLKATLRRKIRTAL